MFPNVLNMIPLTALAAILIIVGFRLAQPKQFIQMWRLGISSFLPFLATIVLTLVDDLLAGVFAGIIVKMIVSFIQGAKLSSFFGPTYRLINHGEMAMLDFDGSLHFFSVIKQKEILSQLNSFLEIEIDLSKLKYIDATSLFLLSKESVRLQKIGRMVKISLPEKYESIFHHIQNH